MSQAQAEKDVDELDDFEDEDDDNSTEFRVRDPLNPCRKVAGNLATT
jgi:hypothetical protein